MWTTTTAIWNLERIVLRRNLVRLGRLGPAKTTSTAGGDETDLLTSGFVSSNSGWVTDMLMVTTTVRMLDWVHGNTSNSWPVVSLSLCLVPGSVGLEEWLVGSLTSGDEADHGSAATNDGLSGA